MSKPIQISLRAGSRIYINGAVVRAKSKVTLELLNDVTFLLDSHVLQADETHTPLRQLYFVLQSILIDPLNAGPSHKLFEVLLQSTTRSFDNPQVLKTLADIPAMVDEGNTFEALRALRSLFTLEASIMRADAETVGGEAASSARPPAVATSEQTIAAA